MSNYSNSYSPIPLISQFHQIPHLDSSLRIVNNDFDLSTSSFYNSYTKSLLTLPTILLALSYFILLSLLFSLLIRSCCFPDISGRNSTTNLNVLTVPLDGSVQTRSCCLSVRNLSYIFYFFCLFTIIADQTIFFGNQYLTTGVNNVQSNTENLLTTCNELNNYGLSLTVGINTLSTEIYNSINRDPSCALAANVESYLTELTNDVNSYNNYISPLPTAVSDANNRISDYGVSYKNDTVWVIYAVIIVCVLGFIFSIWRKSKILLQLSIGINSFIMLIFFIIAAILMIILVKYSNVT